ncbi:hypothetical protein F5Y15DRAFT_351946 [Xylariaceae sp. FL0016]|nr:hypothetical protein F5Y15DRAFT_351946 [Xylariaceae sp. FL0016]
MLATTIFAVSTLLASAASYETHDGYDFEVRFDADAGPQDSPIKDMYEGAAASIALQNLYAHINETELGQDCVATSVGEDDIGTLNALKDCINGEDPALFFKLFVMDIIDANIFWDNVTAQSDHDRTTWVPARTYVKCYFNGSLDATQFAVWTQSDAADDANLHANPEHYYKKTESTSLTSQRSEILEGWGGVSSSFGMKRTNFTVPEYTIPTFGTADYPASWALDAKFALPLQRIGPKVLTSGTQVTFGVLHIAVRDFADEGGPGSGIEIYSAVWYPAWDGAPAGNETEFKEFFLMDEAYHMVVEIINLTLQAQKDCQSGLCVAPS